MMNGVGSVIHGRGKQQRFLGATVTKWLLVILFFLFLVNITGSQTGGRLLPWFSFDARPGSGQFFEFWRLVTYAFVDFVVISWIVTLVILYSLGRLVEVAIGSRRFVCFVLYCIVSGSLVYGLVSYATGGTAILAGASSLNLGLIVIAGLMYPEQQVQLMLPPVRLKLKQIAMWVIGLVIVISILQQLDPSVILSQLSGAAVAYVCIKKITLLDLFKPKRPNTRERNRKKNRTRHRGLKARTILNMDVSKREAEVNRILDKVSAQGIGSLSEQEKEILKFEANND